jgi:murein DD-endopeptidase MepM/ murein hydrolase activator NlpD
VNGKKYQKQIVLLLTKLTSLSTKYLETHMRSPLKKISSSFSIATAIAGSIAILTTSSAYAQVSGEYKGVKLPYEAGQAYQVTGTHASNRRAIDFGMKQKNVLAIKSGKVALVTTDENGGKYILVDHGDGFCAIYLHLESFKVSQNDSVSQGQVIGVSGNTGGIGQYHLHLAVIKKNDGSSGCSTSHAREIAMVFDENPNAPLELYQKITSQNGGSSSPSAVFQSPSSRLSVSVASADLTVQASNISGRNVYVQMYRPSFAGYTAKSWSFQKVANGNSVVFSDMDGAGNTFQGAPYSTVVSLTPFSSDEASQQRSSCFAATGGTRLCDRVSR